MTTNTTLTGQIVQSLAADRTPEAVLPEPEPTTIEARLHKLWPKLDATELTILTAVSEIDSKGRLTIHTPYAGATDASARWAIDQVLDRARELAEGQRFERHVQRQTMHVQVQEAVKRGFGDE